MMPYFSCKKRVEPIHEISSVQSIFQQNNHLMIMNRLFHFIIITSGMIQLCTIISTIYHYLFVLKIHVRSFSSASLPLLSYLQHIYCSFEKTVTSYKRIGLLSPCIKLPQDNESFIIVHVSAFSLIINN